MSLNIKQKAFADYYIETLNGAESYKRAYPNCKTDGTARTNSNKLLQNTDIQLYLEARMAEKDEKQIASANEVLEYLTETMRDLTASRKERTRCAELLGKRHRLFTERVELDANHVVQFIGEDEVMD